MTSQLNFSEILENKKDVIETIDDFSKINRKELIMVIIMVGVTYIPKKAFSEYYNLKSVVIPESVTIIHDDAFNYCESLVLEKKHSLIAVH